MYQAKAVGPMAYSVHVVVDQMQPLVTLLQILRQSRAISRVPPRATS